MIQNERNAIFVHGQPLRGYDAVIPRIGYTVTSYGASVIRQFESMGIPSLLGSEALIRTRDKLSCMQLLSQKGIPVPKTLLINNYSQMSLLHQKIEEFPKILKLKSGTHGLGVLKADDAKSMEAMMEAFYGLKQKVLIQEFIKESSGEDIRAFVVDGEVVASMRRSAAEGEFRSNLHRGGVAETVQLSEEENRVAIDSVAILGLKVAGVDMLQSNHGPLVLEVNASPGLEGIEKTTNVDIAKKIIQLAERVVRGNTTI